MHWVKSWPVLASSRYLEDTYLFPQGDDPNFHAINKPSLKSKTFRGDTVLSLSLSPCVSCAEMAIHVLLAYDLKTSYFCCFHHPPPSNIQWWDGERVTAVQVPKWKRQQWETHSILAVLVSSIIKSSWAVKYLCPTSRGIPSQSLMTSSGRFHLLVYCSWPWMPSGYGNFFHVLFGHLKRGC